MVTQSDVEHLLKKNKKTAIAFTLVITIVVIVLAFNHLNVPYVHDVRAVWSTNTTMYVAWHCDSCNEQNMGVYIDGRRYAVKKTRGLLISPYYEYQSEPFKVFPSIDPIIVQAYSSKYQFDELVVNLRPHGVKIVIGGDIGLGGLQRAVLNTMANHSPDLIFLAGDIVYQSGLDQRQWYQFSKDLESVVPMGMPVMVSKGNHDPAWTMKNTFAMPWRSDESMSYVFHVKHVCFIVLSYDRLMDMDVVRSEIRFVHETLKSLNRTEYPTVVIIDHFPYNTSVSPDHDLKQTEIGKEYYTLIDTLCNLYNVSLTLHGHVHVTEIRRTERLMSVTAGGSVLSYPKKVKNQVDKDVLFFDKKTHCIVVIDFFGGTRFSVDLYSRSNDLVSRFISI